MRKFARWAFVSYVVLGVVSIGYALKTALGRDCWETRSECEAVVRDEDFNELVRGRCTLIHSGEPGEFIIWCPPGTQYASEPLRWSHHRICDDGFDLCKAMNDWRDMPHCLAGPGDRGWCAGVRDGVMGCGLGSMPDECQWFDMRWDASVEDDLCPLTYEECQFAENQQYCTRDGRVGLHDVAAWMIKLQSRLDFNARFEEGDAAGEAPRLDARDPVAMELGDGEG